ncbi:MAG: nucleoside 2-deoxyribosyltransferase domain-containing protein [archaeon]
MKIIYALDNFPKEYSKSIFLAGPTPRDNNIKSWRKNAIEILNKLNYDGVVFIPEQKDKVYKNYIDQVDWETEALNRADCILFWVPRDLEILPGFTTNIEWGMWKNSGKIIMGFPKDTPKTRYIEKQLNDLELPLNNTLEDTIKATIDFIGDGVLRKNGETYVPLYIWKTPMFQCWYDAQLDVGNELRYAKVNYIFKMPKAKKIFLWILHVHVYIRDEDRIKENEFVLSRSDISSVVMYKKGNTIDDTEIVLVREFRSPASNSKAMVYEIPGGSSISNKNELDTMHDEVLEETGLEIDKNRFYYVGSRQLMSTLSSHKCHLFAVELTEEEINIMKNDNDVHGNEEDSERTYIEVIPFKYIITGDLLDWSNIGMIIQAIK